MKFKYRIAYLITPVEFGGAEKVSLNFLQNVNRELFELHPIVFFRPWEADTIFLKELNKENFSVCKIPVSLGKHDHLWLFRRFGMIFSFLKRGHFDLLHTHGYVSDIIGILSATILKIPTIATCHGFIENDRKLALYNGFDRLVLRFSDRIIAVSADIKKNLIEYGIEENRIRTIPNSVKTDIDEGSFLSHKQETRQHVGLSERDFVLGYVGRLSPEKGIRHLINAVALARRGGCPAKLFIIGEGSEKDELRVFARKEELKDHVVFAGFQSDVAQVFPAMDVFVLPSLTEGTPMALLEAMAHGIPVIASAVGQIPEIIDSGKSGFLVQPARPEDIRDKIILLYNDGILRNKIGKAGQRKIKEQFDIKAWTKQIETEYLTVVGRSLRSKNLLPTK